MKREENAMRNRTVLLTILASCVSTSVCADVISDWNEKAVSVVTARQLPPPQAERIMAMVHVAMFDAVNTIERRYRPYLVQFPAAPGASRAAAAAAAAGAVMLGLYPQDAALTGTREAYLAAIPSSDARSEGIKLGEAVAAQVLEARARDGADALDSYRPKTGPNIYVPTALTVGSTWPNLKPFAIASPAQFRPQPPVPLSGEKWTTDYSEIRDLGGRTSLRRSPRQTEDARFWLAPGPIIYYPVVRQVAAAKKLDPVDSARFMALIAVARSDAFIAVFDAKYHYDFWRPITAIRNGDLDDNPATERDATWQPIDNTPSHPEYPCAHCIMAGSIASVVEAVFGSAEVAEVALTSPTAPGVTHRWTNLWAMADEVSQARIWAGFHYRFSTQVGQDMGRKIGQYVVKNIMQSASVADAR
jgi:hypothetical protein